MKPKLMVKICPRVNNGLDEELEELIIGDEDAITIVFKLLCIFYTLLK